MIERLLIASANRGKCRELAREIRRTFPAIEILTLTEFPALILPDEGDDYLANAAAKARAATAASRLPALADDSGLEVAGLNWGPGPHSARFAGPAAKDGSNIKKLLAALHGQPAKKWAARFVCQVALVLPGGELFTGYGEVRGRITEVRRGRRGFGYDPVFIPEGKKQTFAQMAAKEKAELSHRTLALRDLFRRGAAALVQWGQNPGPQQKS